MKKKVWTEIDEENLRKMWNDVSITKISEYFCCSKITIKNKALELGLGEHNSNRWTVEEEKLLREYSEKYIVSEISTKLGRSSKVITKKTAQMGIPVKFESDLTQEQIEYLVQNINVLPIDTILTQLNISMYKLNNKCEELGIKRLAREWSKKEIEILTKNVVKLSYEELTVLLPKRSSCAIAIKAAELNILPNKNREYINKKWGKLPPEVIAKEVGLSVSSLYKHKRQLDILNNKTSNKKPWTENEILILKEYSQKYYYGELIKVLPGRTAASINSKAHELGIKLIYEYVDLDKASIDYIKDNWGKVSITEMSITLGVSLGVIYNYKKKLGLPNIGQKKKWTVDVINTIKQDATNLTKQQLAQKYKTSEHQITQLACENNFSVKSTLDKLPAHHAKKWTVEEEQQLLDLWGYKSIEYISKKLNRTVSAIKSKAHKLELGSSIYSNYNGVTFYEISKLFNVSVNVIGTNWINLGLKTKVQKISEFRNCRYVEINDLYEFLEKNQDSWDSRVLEKNILGIEPDWLKEKRKRDEISNKKFDQITLTKQQLLLSKKFLLEYQQQMTEFEENEIGHSLIKK